MLNGFVPVYQLSRRALEHPLSIGLADPAVTWPLRVILGSTVLGIAMVFGARTIRTFGIDYMLVVYLYYPEESTVQNHDIYSVIRHPTYAGWLLVVLSTTLFRASVYGAIDFVLFYLAVTVWARRVEERELVERSGEDYRKYMREVPAFVDRTDGGGLSHSSSVVTDRHHERRRNNKQSRK